jgi:dTDP-4-dehydrorhamnose reductase
MKILLTGASGLVGSAFAVAASRRGHHVVGLVGQFTGEVPGLGRKLGINLTEETAIERVVLEEFPDAIANCAAVSTPEACDADPALAQRLNVDLPATLARLAHHLSARLVHLSSEQVFDGSRAEPYAVGDVVSPINLYGRQKVESERAVHTAAPAFAATIRAPLLMGNSVAGQRSTHERLFADWAAGRASKLYRDEFRQPCTAENLAEVMVELCERRDVVANGGVFHWAGSELLSRHALGVKIREHFKLTAEQAPIVAVTRAEQPDAARKRQACLALDLAPLAGRLKTRPESIAEQLPQLHVPPPCRSWYLGLTT